MQPCIAFCISSLSIEVCTKNTGKEQKMRLWQQSMIFLARNQFIKNFMQNYGVMTELSKKFVGGQNVSTAVKMASTLKKDYGFHTSLFNLGEYVSDKNIISTTVKTLKSGAASLSNSGLDIHISVDPTQIGYQVDPAICIKNSFELADTIKNQAAESKLTNKNFLMLDMEDSTVTQATVDLYTDLKNKELPAAITLQAYLYRTKQDVAEIIKTKGAIRLVKGAFAEKQNIAFTDAKKIDSNFIKLADMMLSQKARQSDFYPIFGTHDNNMIDKIIKIAQSRNWKQGEYEFEMLYGVRRKYQEKLIQSGEKLRLYLPFGSDWWPYAIRRVGENPKNAKFVLNALCRK